MRQYGFISIPVIAGLLVVAWIGLKVAPVFQEHGRLKNVVRVMQLNPGLTGVRSKDLREIFGKEIKSNRITSITKDDLVIDKTKGDWVLSVRYERVVPLIGNIGVLFDLGVLEPDPG